MDCSDVLERLRTLFQEHEGNCEVMIHLKNGEEKKLLVLDVPLLASSTLRDFCDEIIFVNSDESLRESRTQLRGWSKQELKDREACQMPENDKKELAGFIINNSGSILGIWEKFQKSVTSSLKRLK